MQLEIPAPNAEMHPKLAPAAADCQHRSSMFPLDLSLATALYTGLGALAIAALWFWADRRDRQFYDQTRRRTTFHCIKCNRVYTSAESHEVCRCPACGHENTRLKF